MQELLLPQRQCDSTAVPNVNNVAATSTHQPKGPFIFGAVPPSRKKEHYTDTTKSTVHKPCPDTPTTVSRTKPPRVLYTPPPPPHTHNITQQQNSQTAVQLLCAKLSSSPPSILPVQSKDLQPL